MQKKAATILLINDNKVLGVSRKNDPNDFGLPGGKVENNETYKEAAIRELKEETGLRAYNLVKIFEDIDGDFNVVTFFTKDYFGDIKSSERGLVKWIEPEELLKGSFGKYNEKLLKSIDYI